MPPTQVVLFIVGTIVILLAAYYVTYFIGMKATGQTRAGLRNRNISLLDRYAISRDKQFCIIEIADKVYIVGVTNHTMTLLDTIDAAVFADLTKDNGDSVTPWNLTPVGQYGNKLTKYVVDFIAEKTGKKQQYNNKAGSGNFAESLRDAELAANEENDDNNENDESDESTGDAEIEEIIIEEIHPEEVSPDNPHESMKAWRNTDAD